MASIKQPVIRGIQAVGSCTIKYRYNNAGTDNSYTLPAAAGIEDIKCGVDGIQLTGFRLDSEFLRANPQIASSIVIPILGGGGVALTNNNRTGTLSLSCARVSRPTAKSEESSTIPAGAMTAAQAGGIGVLDTTQPYYEAVMIAQAQQAQAGGDSLGATIWVSFEFNGKVITVQFEGCTVATVDPIGLSGNDAVQYSIVWNYLNWGISYNRDTDALLSDISQEGTGK